MYLLGIDLGSTGVKATLADKSGKFLQCAYRAYQKQSVANGYNELDAENVWLLALDVISEVTQNISDAVLGLSISSFGESFVLLDEKDQCLSNIILYSDYRGHKEISALERDFGKQDLIGKTGLLPNKSFSIAKLLWIKNNQTKIYENITSFLPVGSYILYRLCGEKIVDHSLASRTYLYNLKQKNWDKDLLQYCALEQSCLPRIAEIGSVAGTIKLSLAKQLNLNSDLKIILGGHDQICCMIGSGLSKISQAMDGMGTVDCITPVFASDLIKGNLVSDGYAQVPYRNNLYTTYAYIYDSGSLIDWFRKNYLANLEQEAKQQNVPIFSLLSQKMPKDINELLVLPHFSGAATPYQDDNSKGLIYGLTLNTTPIQIYKAILESIAFEMKVNILALEQKGIEINEIIASGGGSVSSDWLQIKADIYNKPIYQLEITEAGTLGVIILAGLATGAMQSFEQVINQNIRKKAVFLPNPDKVKCYEDKFQHYQKLYQAQKMIRS